MTNPGDAPFPAIEALWTLTKDGRRFTCQIQSRGKFGWDCRFIEGGEVLEGRHFAMRAEAVEWADAERDEHESEGWTTEE